MASTSETMAVVSAGEQDVVPVSTTSAAVASVAEGAVTPHSDELRIVPDDGSNVEKVGGVYMEPNGGVKVTTYEDVPLGSEDDSDVPAQLAPGANAAPVQLPSGAVAPAQLTSGEIPVSPTLLPAGESVVTPETDEAFVQQLAEILADWDIPDVRHLDTVHEEAALDMATRTVKYSLPMLKGEEALETEEGVRERITHPLTQDVAPVEPVVSTEDQAAKEARRLSLRKRIADVAKNVQTKFKNLYEGSKAEALVNRLEGIAQSKRIAKEGGDNISNGVRSEGADETLISTGIHNNGFISGEFQQDDEGKRSVNIVLSGLDSAGEQQGFEVPASQASNVREQLARTLGQEGATIDIQLESGEQVRFLATEMLAEYKRLTEQLGENWSSAYSNEALNKIRERLGLETVGSSEVSPRSLTLLEKAMGSLTVRANLERIKKRAAAKAEKELKIAQEAIRAEIITPPVAECDKESSLAAKYKALINDWEGIAGLQTELDHDYPGGKLNDSKYMADPRRKRKSELQDSRDKRYVGLSTEERESFIEQQELDWSILINRDHELKPLGSRLGEGIRDMRLALIQNDEMFGEISAKEDLEVTYQTLRKRLTQLGVEIPAFEQYYANTFVDTTGQIVWGEDAVAETANPPTPVQVTKQPVRRLDPRLAVGVDAGDAPSASAPKVVFERNRALDTGVTHLGGGITRVSSQKLGLENMPVAKVTLGEGEMVTIGREGGTEAADIPLNKIPDVYSGVSLVAKRVGISLLISSSPETGSQIEVQAKKWGDDMGKYNEDAPGLVELRPGTHHVKMSISGRHSVYLRVDVQDDGKYEIRRL